VGAPTIPALDRAYSLIEIKAIDEEQRIVRGMATTPARDRGGDIVEPFGVKFSNPLPFILHHDKSAPVGDVFFLQPTAEGIPFEARIPKVKEPGVVRDRVDEAWHSAKYGLIKGVSIGYRILKASPIKGGGLHLQEIEVVELSMVSVPMNAETTITAIKSLDDAHLAATGTNGALSHTNTAGVTAVVHLARKDAPAMTPQERIKSLEASRAAKASEREGIQTKVDAENRTKDAAEREKFDTLTQEIKDIDAEIVDAKDLEADAVKAATRVEVKTADDASRVRGGDPKVVVLKPNLAKGTLFTRYAMAMAAGRGSMSDTLAFAKRWDSQTPEVSKFVRDNFERPEELAKAVEGTTTGTSPGWGSELVYAQNLVSEFVDLLRARTIIDRLTGVRRVPFNVRIPVMSGGATVNWVAEAAVKPVTQPDFDTVTVGYHKISGIVVLTDELVKLSQPNAEEAVRTDLVEQIVRFMDRQLIDPTVTATSARPASITNGVASPAASGTDADAVYADMNTALATFDNAEVGTETIHVLMPPSVARAISSLRNALGQFEFPGYGSGAGWTLMGFPVIVSSSVPAATMILVKADEILMADDGRVDLDASNQATLDMAGGSSPTFSLWQKNCIGIRAERGVSWKKRRSAAVAVIDTIAYAP
jgi:HK97 family phage major capsid protein